MWYKIDFTRFVQQLLPPILRSKVMMALFRVLITPIRHLYDNFLTYKDGISARLNITANVQYIQKALNDAFYLTDNQIYIETTGDVTLAVLYFKDEEKPVTYLYGKGGTAIYAWESKEKTNVDTCIIYIPSFLCTSLDANEDEYKGENMQLIYNLFNYYKPAGRTCRIVIYDYE